MKILKKETIRINYLDLFGKSLVLRDPLNFIYLNSFISNPFTNCSEENV